MCEGKSAPTYQHQAASESPGWGAGCCQVEPACVRVLRSAARVRAGGPAVLCCIRCARIVPVYQTKGYDSSTNKVESDCAAGVCVCMPACVCVCVRERRRKTSMPAWVSEPGCVYHASCQRVCVYTHILTCVKRVEAQHEWLWAMGGGFNAVSTVPGASSHAFPIQINTLSSTHYFPCHSCSSILCLYVDATYNNFVTKLIETITCANFCSQCVFTWSL